MPEPATALGHLARARELFAAAGDPRHESIALMYAGDAHAADGDRAEARQAWSAALTTLIGLDDPTLTAVAAALATGAVAEVTAGGKAAFTALVRLVRRKATEQPAAATALAAAQRAPSDGQRIAQLSAALTAAALNDQVFAAELQRLWSEVMAGRTTDDHSRASNTISGPVRGPAVQARDIHGGVHFGSEG